MILNWFRLTWKPFRCFFADTFLSHKLRIRGAEESGVGQQLLSGLHAARPAAMLVTVTLLQGLK